MSDAKKTYSEKLRDPRWQRMRLEVMNRDEFTCQVCYDKAATLNVHHRWYRFGADPWDYPAEALVTLCESCHAEEKEQWQEIEHDLILALKRRFLAFEAKRFVLIADGMAMPEVPELVVAAVELYLRDETHVKQIIDWYSKDASANPFSEPSPGDKEAK
jgi:hypothetical protein